MKFVLNGCPVLSEGMAQFVSKPFLPYFLSVALPLFITSYFIGPCMSQLFCFRARFHCWLFPFIFPATNPVRPCYRWAAPVSCKTNPSWYCLCSCCLNSSWQSSGAPSACDITISPKQRGLGIKISQTLFSLLHSRFWCRHATLLPTNAC